MLNIIIKYANLIVKETDIHSLIKLIAQFGREITLADRCSIWIIDKAKDELWTIVAQDIAQKELRIPLDKGIVGYAIKTQQPIIVNDAYHSDIFYPELDKLTGYKTNCLMTIPVNDTNGHTIGAIQVVNKKDDLPQEFSDEDLEYLKIASSYIGDSLETLFLQQELKAMNDRLSVEVEEKTKELKNINQVLEEKIKEEIEKNREKDMLLMNQAKQAQMGEMLGVIAHQWKQPLAIINAVCSNASLEIMLDSHNVENAQKNYNFIIEQIKFLRDTIDEFRHFFNPNKKKDTFFVNDMIAKVLNLIEKDFATKNVVISKNYHSSIKVTSYQNEIMHVILNICNNAKDIIMEKNIKNGKILITSIDEDNSTYIYIHDNGGGIPQDVIDKIFDPYFSTKGEKKGTGIGLNLSKMIIEDKCNGKLTAINEDDGAKFIIQIPNTKE